ncbi:hypothetical protein A2165_03795 [Candidatus Curtissbacteria bacterium RBG_13_40_7]|uniref:ATP-cone domain-containing protein n=1 Tax=Candidatus Curtissbacteria bacterium RBG_13_40_7 TaxID=1797706 RepID=A0A1F5FUJ1_9BACT|nr:MAG: hypothetical protein A2165_03795 [Candidatus Curtissbacteria bacterium RBG_13_40_7]
MNLQIIKKDGSKENFDINKIVRVVTAAGLHPDQSQNLAQIVFEWFQKQGKSQISALEIRNKVIEELSKVDKFAVDAYTWYEKTKDGETNQS